MPMFINYKGRMVSTEDFLKLKAKEEKAPVVKKENKTTSKK